MKTIVRRTLVRLVAAAVMAATLVSVFAVGAFAVEPTQEGGFWVVNADKIDEILAGEAGEATTGWEVPFLTVPPTLDGKISKGEYQPFDMYEDYMSYMAAAGNGEQGNSKEDFMEFYELAKDNLFDAYWGWDGRYLYLAFEVRCINGFRCTPEDMGGSVYLYAYNMMQLGIAPVDAIGKDPDYVELGFGVNSETGEPITHTWAGPYYPVAGEDFMGTYDSENQVVVYEARVHLQTALGLDRTVENGDEINFAWLLSVNGATSSVYDFWQVAFCHGIGGQYSHKVNQYFARVTFTGKDVQLDPETIPGISEEDKEYRLMEFVDMSDEKTVESFSGENATMESVTENGETFARITVRGEDSFVWSSTYPRNLQSADCTAIVVKYRYPQGDESELGIMYRNAFFPEYDMDDMYTEKVGGDGDWHVVIFFMDGEPRWQNFIVNMGFAPFAGEDDAAGKTIDIAFAKFYGEDPYDLFEDDFYDSDKQGEATAEETLPETVAEGDDTNETVAANDDTATEQATSKETETEGESSGCASVLGVSGVVLLAVGAAAVLRKKKD